MCLWKNYWNHIFHHVRHSTSSKATCVTVAFAVLKDESIMEKAKSESIPEFMRFNIVESGVRNVS